jgi:hypothetical protein
MGINMSYCMFENTVTAMEEIKERMWEEDFDPDELNQYERRAYDQLYEICSSIMQSVEEMEERKYEEDIARQLEEENNDSEE